MNRHVVILNPAASVKGVKEHVIEGKTPEITIEQARPMLRSVDTGHVVGLRDFQHDGTQYVLRFQEKGGKSREIPVRHNLKGFILAYIDAAGIAGEAKDTPLFRASNGRSRKLGAKPLGTERICELVKRRLKDAGLRVTRGPETRSDTPVLSNSPCQVDSHPRRRLFGVCLAESSINGLCRLRKSSMKTEFSLVTGLALVLVVVMAAVPGPAAAQGKDPTKTTTKADAAAVQSQPESNDARSREISAEAFRRSARRRPSPTADAGGMGGMGGMMVPGSVAPTAQPKAAQPTVVRSLNGRLDVELVLDYALFKIGNDQVRLRTYNGHLVGPTLRARAGDTLFVTLRNRLPVEPDTKHEANDYHNWNTTNLHYHGLHVAPKGTNDLESDNVLIKLEPSADGDGSIQKYAVHIPKEHPAGTFWYHPHVHGSTTPQVASGAAGALIIEREDDSLNLDRNPAIKAAAEEILVLQQIPYLMDRNLRLKCRISSSKIAVTERSKTSTTIPQHPAMRMYLPGT